MFEKYKKYLSSDKIKEIEESIVKMLDSIEFLQKILFESVDRLN
jgi:hypothetical protein